MNYITGVLFTVKARMIIFFKKRNHFCAIDLHKTVYAVCVTRFLKPAICQFGLEFVAQNFTRDKINHRKTFVNNLNFVGVGVAFKCDACDYLKYKSLK